MAVVRTILTVLFFVIGAIIVILAFMQTKEDEGLSSTITGSSTNNFYEKNKACTKEGKQKRWTKILSIVFAIITIVLGILYMA
jgi:preprotein translocase, secG subunit